MSDSVRPHRWQPTRLPRPWDSRQEYWSGLPFPSPMRESEVTQSCPTPSDPMDCGLAGSSVRGIFPRVLDWAAIHCLLRTQLLRENQLHCFGVAYWSVVFSISKHIVNYSSCKILMDAFDKQISLFFSAQYLAIHCVFIALRVYELSLSS